MPIPLNPFPLVCDGCHWPENECQCVYDALERALEGDEEALERLPYPPWLIDELLAGRSTPDDLAPIEELPE